MKVEIWSDFMCPFCYIGKRRFEQALDQFAGKGETEVIFRSFELNPQASNGESGNVHAMLAQKYGMSLEQARASTSDLTQQAAAVGLSFNFDTMVNTNSFDAHRLIYFAEKNSKAAELTELMFKASFTDGTNISSREALAGLAAAAGLDRGQAAQALEQDDFTREVRSDEEEAQRLGIRGVPYFVIDRKYAVSGAQSPEMFLQALNKAWEERKPVITPFSLMEPAAPVARVL